MATAYTCFVESDPRFGPAVKLISAITQADPAVITTQSDHGYVTGTIVRIRVPKADGMIQIDGLKGPITVLSDTQFSIPINTTSFDAFAIPGSPTPDDDICALVIPIGQINAILTAAVRNVS
jgi:hypothetical protein